jgi:hypothetical protein
MVHHRDAANASRTQVQRHRRAQTTRADNQGMCTLNALLAFHADLVEQDVARVTK